MTDVVLLWESVQAPSRGHNRKTPLDSLRLAQTGWESLKKKWQSKECAWKRIPTIASDYRMSVRANGTEALEMDVNLWRIFVVQVSTWRPSCQRSSPSHVCSSWSASPSDCCSSTRTASGCCHWHRPPSSSTCCHRLSSTPAISCPIAHSSTIWAPFSSLLLSAPSGTLSL